MTKITNLDDETELFRTILEECILHDTSFIGLYYYLDAIYRHLYESFL
jgi:hypothetical protein